MKSLVLVAFLSAASVASALDTAAKFPAATDVDIHEPKKKSIASNNAAEAVAKKAPRDLGLPSILNDADVGAGDAAVTADAQLKGSESDVHVVVASDKSAASGSGGATPTAAPTAFERLSPVHQDALSQLAQYDILSFMVPDPSQQHDTGYPYWIDEAAIIDLLKAKKVGSFLNSPSSQATMPVPTIAWWRKLQDRLYVLSTTYGSKIPIIYGLDSVHGAGYIRGATLFPQSIGVGATFNVTAAAAVGHVAGVETRYAGIPWNFDPILGIAVQPTWARVYETFGESPKLVEEMGEATIIALQAPPSEGIGLPTAVKHTVAACMKHFIGFSNSRTGRNRTPSWIPMNFLLQYFLPPFERVAKLALTAMENEVEVNGRPVVASYLMLAQVLRTVIGFEGMLVTDYDEVYSLADFHYTAKTYDAAVQQSLNQTTIDMVMVSSPKKAKKLLVDSIADHIANGGLSLESMMERSSRVMLLKEKVGLFAGSPVPKPILNSCYFGCDGHRKDALDVARQSITLLQNEKAQRKHVGTPMLPRKDLYQDKIVIVGQHCDSVPLMSGGWSVYWQGTTDKSQFPWGTTIVEEFKRRMGPGQINLQYFPGCNYTEGSTCDPHALQEAVTAAMFADWVLVCVGERPYAEQPGDLDDLTMPGQQIEMVERLSAANPNIVTVLVEGRPRVLNSIVKNSAAIVMAYLPGPAGSEAVVDVVTGKISPSGRLPITYPKTTNNGPVQSWRAFSSNQFGDYDPQWEFGHGLSYTSFHYTSIAAVFADSGIIKLNITVKNTGPIEATEAVLVFSTQAPRVIAPEVRMLRAFSKVLLKPGESRSILQEFSFKDFGYYNEVNTRIIDLETPVVFTAYNSDGSKTETVLIMSEWVTMHQSEVVLTNLAWRLFYKRETERGQQPYVAPTVSPPGTSSSAQDFLLSSIVCFVAGIVGTVIIVSLIRRARQNSQIHLLEPPGV